MRMAICPDCGAMFRYPEEEEEFDQRHLTCYTFEPVAEFKLPDLKMCSESDFWYFISERHKIFLKREAGEPKPWTADPILQKYKFVNVFRQYDRTTRWLLENFLIPHEQDDIRDIAFNICWYRMYNRWETGELLGWQMGWNPNEVVKKLRRADFPIFTGAYIIHSDWGRPKLDSITEVCDALWTLCHHTSFKDVLQNGMEATWRFLQQANHVGPFMAYQMVLDMGYCPRLLGDAHDYHTWTCTGPGALRGLKRLDSAASMRDSLDRMADLTWRAPMSLAEIEAFHVPKLSVHDIEFCLCELDKYCRVKFGEGRPRSSYPGV